MTDTIEPTEEQKQAARSICKSPYPHDIARFLAEREHKLREEIVEIAAERDTRQADVARLEAKLSRPQPLGTVLLDENETLRADLDAAHARIAELEATTRQTDTDRDLTMYTADPAAVTRAVCAVDFLFESVGGSSWHYVNECLLPALEDEGLHVIYVKKVMLLAKKAGV